MHFLPAVFDETDATNFLLCLRYNFVDIPKKRKWCEDFQTTDNKFCAAENDKTRLTTLWVGFRIL